MSGIPVAIPLAWTTRPLFHLQSDEFRAQIGSDCLRHRRHFR
jgi:hypothetical protein